MPPLTSPVSELSSVTTELQSIENLLHNVLQRQALLSSRLAKLQQDALSNPGSLEKRHTPGSSTDCPLSKSLENTSKKPRRVSLPLFCPDGNDDDPIPLSNFFSPLEELTESASVSPQRVPHQSAHARPKAAKKRPISPATPLDPRGKRPRRPSPGTLSNSSSECECSPASSHQPPTHASDPALDTVATGDDVVSGDLITGGAIFQSPDLIDRKLPSLPPKLAIYNRGCVGRQADILIIGDSIVRSVEIPGAVTYCLPGGKVADIIELSPMLINLHPSAHTLIVHVGTNDVMDKQSVKLYEHFESLALKIQDLGKTCIFSGPIPTSPLKGSERFSRLVSLHEWLKYFCLATGYGFISQFDSFWTRPDLYKPDGLHPNIKGVKLFTTNLIYHIAFNFNYNHIHD